MIYVFLHLTFKASFIRNIKYDKNNLKFLEVYMEEKNNNLEMYVSKFWGKIGWIFVLKIQKIKNNFENHTW